MVQYVVTNCMVQFGRHDAQLCLFEVCWNVYPVVQPNKLLVPVGLDGVALAAVTL